ncbi:dihydrolipoamide acetyltransferase family protein [Halococcus qingdaonensis]|uniref:dihydrolipoamide acetyltransferase family protein n=1 Tax=Halococcus qingdaonensis TaxID=224402 RepID=UPI0021165126|nr:dihydrolipoamide acetyltransferase family protein [Halococcus qingdaonensis]
MVREFELPDVGEGVAEGEIVDWLVEEGDAVEEDQPVAEVETDKAVVDVPSPVNGSVREIHAEAGEMVPVGTVIITFAEEGDDESDEATSTEESTETDATTETSAAAEAETTAEETADEETPTASGRVFAAPSARRLARELGVDIGNIDGSGPGGRVSEHDVRAAAEDATGAGGEEESDSPEPAATRIEDSDEADAGETDTAGGGAAQASSASQSASSGAMAGESADRERTLAAPATRKLAADSGVDIDAVPTDEERDGEAFVTPAAIESYAEAQQAAQDADRAALAGSREEERIPYRGVRRTIGQQMAASKYTAPHVTHHDEVDVTALVEARTDLKELADEQGISLSYMPFVMKACVAALREFPMVNSMLDEEAEEIVQKKYYNIGVATATDAGLMVPVVEDADRKNMLQLASEMNELVEKARERTISRDEMQGGTFTITNVGAIGGEYATPIVNHPEVAILALGAIKEKPRVKDGEIVPRKVMTLSLSIDHRVVDGAIAAQFTNRVEEFLETPQRLLLEA